MDGEAADGAARSGSEAECRSSSRAAIGPPSQSRYCGLRVLLVTVMIATVASTISPTATGEGSRGAIGPDPERDQHHQAGHGRHVADQQPGWDAGPEDLVRLEGGHVDPPTAGRHARASISGVAQIDSICRPRPDCQVNGESSRVQPPVSRLSPARPKPTIDEAPAGGLAVWSVRAEGRDQERGPEFHRRTQAGQRPGDPGSAAGGQQRAAGQHGGQHVEPQIGQWPDQQDEQQPEVDGDVVSTSAVAPARAVEGVGEPGVQQQP